MTIKIVARQTVSSSGEHGYIVEEIEALRHEKLPSLYTDWGPSVYLGKTTFDYNVLLGNNFTGDTFIFVVSYYYSDDDFHKRLEFVIKCGERLMSINKKLKKLRKEWSELETFVI
jgi:hypothetical protein